MLARLKAQPLAFVAVFLLITGSAVAVGGPSLSGKDIKNGTIGPQDLKPELLNKVENPPPGPQGKKGAAGKPGAPGPAGTEGRKGADGTPGAEGSDGSDGATGASGASGADGEGGPTGPRGLQGEIGPAGPQGGIGPTGPQGEIGPAGAGTPDGASVMMGRIDPAGAAECLAGSPVGFTTAAGCNDIGRDTRKMQMPVTKTLRNFIASVDSQVAVDASVAIVSRGINTTSNLATCTIPATASGCLISGPVSVPAGTRLLIEVNFDPASTAVATPQGVMFGYELFKP